MSLIADALKKAQRIGHQPAEGLPPFDLKKPAVEPVESPRQAPEKPRSTVATVTGAPRPKPIAGKEAAEKAGIIRKFRSRRLLIAAAAALLLVSSGVFYVYKVYIPSIGAGGMTVAPSAARTTTPEPSPAEVEQPEQAAPDELSPEEPATEDQAASVPEEPGEPEVVSPRPDSRISRDQPPAEPGQSDLAREDYSTGQGIPSEIPENDQLPPLEEALPLPEPPARTEIVPRVREESREIRQDIYHFNMAVYFQRRGDIQAALEEYGKVIEVSPHNAEVYSNMGVLYNQVGDYDKAVSVLHRALLIDPRYSKAHNNLGLAYYRSGQTNKALEHLSKAADLDPTSRDVFNNLGLVHKSRDEMSLAEAAFLSALNIDDGYAAAHYNLALLYDEIGRLDHAAEHYSRFLDCGGGSLELNQKVRGRLTRLGFP